MSQPDAEQAEQLVDEARQRLMDRIDALSGHLSTPSLLAQLISARDGDESSEDLLSAVGRLLRDRPLSSVLIGSGLLGLALGRRAPPASVQSPDVADRANLAGTRPTASTPMGEQVIDKASEATSQARDAAYAFGDLGRDGAKSAARSTPGHLDKPYEALSKSLDEMPDLAARQIRRTAHWIDNNRLAAGVGALAVGAVIASLVAARRDHRRHAVDADTDSRSPATQENHQASADLPGESPPPESPSTG